MKPSFEWAEDDVQQLIEQKVKESANLEYKQCSALRTEGYAYNCKNKKSVKMEQTREKFIAEVSKDVSAFSNADGGTIIYGVVEDNHIPLHIDKYPYDLNEINKEWLENIIDTNISRKIQGLKVNQIELKSNPEHFIFVIYIPQSLQGAIQANDYRYYQRRNFKAEPMEDYQVRDVMNRFNFPLLEAELDYKTISKDPKEHHYSLRCILTNIGNITAVNFGIDIYFPEEFLDISHFNQIIVRQGFSEGRVGKEDSFYKKTCYRNFGNEYVLFPSESFPVLNGKNIIEYVVNYGNWERLHLYRLKWILFADNMPPKSGEKPIFEEF
jgi:hypothetical protein